MLAHAFAMLGDVPAASNSWSLDPGEAGWGDVIFVVIWAFGSLLLAAYYCYRAFFSR